MSKIAIIIHGGAGPDSDFIKEHIDDYKKALKEAADTGYKVLEDGGNAVDAVEAAVNFLEDNALFNAGRGSALNKKAEVEMGASIMNGANGKSGSTAIVKNVKNPITLARAVMEKTKHISLGDMGALEFAQSIGLKVMPEAYFITDHAWEQYLSATEEEENTPEEAGDYQAKRKSHGTVGAVALDKDGNIAAGTSTGGTENKVPGRLDDSCIIGIGSYADNATCAVSSTGDGEYLIRHVMGFHLAALIKYKGVSVKEAARYLLHEELKEVEGDMGFIALDTQGNLVMEFNSDRMHRAWRSSDGESGVGLYPSE
jgi:L-asparaginase / beta-aspartyl-peptidase